MSRPRREWWSFLLDRRCPVRSLMRWVSRAIWTRVLPVSCSFAPNLVTISRVCSGVSVVMRRSRVAPLGGYRPCFFDIPPHLLDQIVDRREAPFAAQALDELDGELLAVEIALPVDEEGLDQLVATGLELGPHADVDGGRHSVGPCCIDAVAGNHVALRRHEVGGWEAQLAPALVAVDDLAAHGERVAQQLARV